MKSDVSVKTTSLTEEEFSALHKVGKEKVIPKGEIIIEEGEVDETVYFILEGEVEVLKNIEGHQQKITTLGAGKWVGEIAFVREIPRTTQVIAVEDSKVIEVDRKAFDSLDPKFQVSLMKRFTNLAAERIATLIRREENLISQRDDLITYIKSLQSDEKNTYMQSQMIQTIIKKVPRLPMYAGELIMMINDPETNAREIADKIREDPNLAAQVLKYVNSPYYGFQQKIWDLKHAIMLLGFNQVYQLVLYNAIRGTMPNTRESRSLQMHSVILSVIATEIATITNPKRVALASTLGLLHDIGKSVVLYLKDAYPKMDVIFDTLDTAVLGSMLLEEWGLPEELCEGICFQHYFQCKSPFDMPDQCKHNVSILTMSHMVMNYVLGKQEERIPNFILNYMEDHGIEESTTKGLSENIIIPVLNKKKKALPTLVRKFIQGKLKNVEGENMDSLLYDPSEVAASG